MKNPLAQAVDATILNSAKRAAKRKDANVLEQLLAKATYGETKLAIKRMLVNL